MSFTAEVVFRGPSAQALLGVQSTVAAFSGTIAGAHARGIQVSVPPQAAPDVLQTLRELHPEDWAPSFSVGIVISLVEHGETTTLLLHTKEPMLYFVSSLGIDRSTLDAFVTTLEANYVSLAGGRRPPDRPPPGRPGR